MAESESRIPASLYQKARLSLVLTCLVVVFDVVAFRTNWLLPRPLFCGTIQAENRWRPVAAADLGRESSDSGTRVCVHEVIHPYSSLSGSASVVMSVRDAHRLMSIYELQFFIGRNLGSRQHNDIPGDWIFMGETKYNAFGWRVSSSAEHTASWSSQFFTLPIRKHIWRMVQQNIGNSSSVYQLSLQRRLAVFLATNGALLLSLVAVVYAFIEALGLHQLIFSGRLLRVNVHTIVRRWRRLSREGVHLSLSRRRLGRLLFITSLLAITSMLVISRCTSWLMPRAFWCQSYAGSWRVCLHEIYHPPSKNLRMIVMGVSVYRPDRSHLYASMQFFTALPRDGIGFVDVPGSWHFQDRYYFNSQGWLVDHRPQTLSSIVDPLMPSRVQVALWNDIAFEVQERFKARRLTIQSKLIEVSDSYLFMLLAVIMATWTALNYMELWILNHEFKSTGSLKPRSE